MGQGVLQSGGPATPRDAGLGVDPKLAQERWDREHPTPPPRDPFLDLIEAGLLRITPREVIEAKDIPRFNPFDTDGADAVVEFLEEKSISTLAKKLARLPFAAGVIAEHLDIAGRPLNTREADAERAMIADGASPLSPNTRAKIADLRRLNDAAIAKVLRIVAANSAPGPNLIALREAAERERIRRRQLGIWTDAGGGGGGGVAGDLGVHLADP